MCGEEGGGGWNSAKSEGKQKRSDIYFMNSLANEGKKRRRTVKQTASETGGREAAARLAPKNMKNVRCEEAATRWWILIVNKKNKQWGPHGDIVMAHELATFTFNTVVHNK